MFRDLKKVSRRQRVHEHFRKAVDERFWQSFAASTLLYGILGGKDAERRMSREGPP
jgi:hypothetical protein